MIVWRLFCRWKTEQLCWATKSRYKVVWLLRRVWHGLRPMTHNPSYWYHNLVPVPLLFILNCTRFVWYQKLGRRTWIVCHGPRNFKSGSDKVLEWLLLQQRVWRHQLFPIPACTTTQRSLISYSRPRRACAYTDESSSVVMCVWSITIASLHDHHRHHCGWWRGLALTRWSRSTSGPVSTWMGDPLRAGKLSWSVASHLGMHAWYNPYKWDNWKGPVYFSTTTCNISHCRRGSLRLLNTIEWSP